MVVRKIPVSPEWRSEWRRNGAGLMTVATVAAFGYVSACQTFVVLSNGKLTHPTWWSWPFWICLFLALIGVYTFLASYHDRLPYPGREYFVDHSTKYALGLQAVNLELTIWTDDSPEPGRFDARMILGLVNGSRDHFLHAYLENMDVTIAGIHPEVNNYSCREIRILPQNFKFFKSPTIARIPVGDNVRGEISYSIIYGPPGGYPAYRRTHKIMFYSHQILSPGVNPGGIEWQDLEPEADDDMPDGAPEASESTITASLVNESPASVDTAEAAPKGLKPIAPTGDVTSIEVTSAEEATKLEKN